MLLDDGLASGGSTTTFTILAADFPFLATGLRLFFFRVRELP